MPTQKSITDAFLKRVKSPKQDRVDYFDIGYPGLHIRVSHTGRKVWGYYCRPRRHGKLARLVFDHYPAMSVAAAHDAWRKARDDIAAGKDPRASKIPASATDFGSVFEDWLKRDQAGNKSRALTESRIRAYVLPAWKHKEITQIGRRDCLDAIDLIADQGKIVLARRIQSHLHRLFTWAVGRGIIDANPLLNAEKPGSEKPRERVLDDAEFARVWHATAKLSAPFGNAIRLLALTGARRDEIACLKWTEVQNGTIVLEGERTKNGKTHIVPLSSPAAAILANVPRSNGGEFVFTSTGKKPIAGWGPIKARLDELSGVTGWTIHDIRRTVATGLQKQGTPLPVTEAVLGHTSGSRSGIVGVYQRHDYAKEKAAALEAWGAHVMALVEGAERGKVLALARGRDPVLICSHNLSDFGTKGSS